MQVAFGQAIVVGGVWRFVKSAAEPAELTDAGAAGNEALRSQNTFFWNERVDEITA